jgi:hypothetical protein
MVRKHASALLLEGAKDVRVFRNLVSERACDIVSTEGKINALDALNLLRRSNQKGVLVVIDADFTVLDGQQVIDPDVITTDGHDLEAMLLKSPAAQKVMIEYDLAVDEFGTDIGEVLARAVMPIGYLRLASLRSKLNLKFTDLAFSAFTELKRSVRIDEQKLVNEVLTKNPASPHNAAVLGRLMRSVVRKSDDCWHVACGHDMTALFALLLGHKAGREVPAYTVERQLRLSYHSSHFSVTRLFANIRAWEQRNVPHIILA